MTDTNAPTLVILGATIAEAQSYYKELVSFDPDEVFGFNVRITSVASVVNYGSCRGLGIHKLITTPHAIACPKGGEADHQLRLAMRDTRPISTF